MTTPNAPRLLTRTEVAQLLDISPRSLDRLVNASLIPVVRINRRPRFFPEDVLAFVLDHRTPKAPEASASGSRGRTE